ncbi:immunoglobulin-like domain-containing protein [Allobacillus sp. GCM10007491]|uniref:Bacterial Ig-like domain-containing protein n=1 Tax=Allobacillus saliphilus TaxID=2912308 RepID=A0A941HU21_9BACI|nr:immunoglobulin-like domain-containing protein [Allobacillus saliphilus]MBR7554963.1 hypothetical protein [Allobacillus saliphilus]
MKKILLYTMTFLLSVFLVGCNTGNADTTGGKDKKPTQYDTVNNFEGVSMSVKESSVSPTGLTVIFENKSDEQGVYSEDFLLEEEIEGNWYEVPTIVDEYGFAEPGYELPPSKTEEFAVEWESLYGNLDSGNYQIIKSMSNVREPGDYDEYYLAAQFKIE